MRLFLVKSSGGYFVPASDLDRDASEKLKNGIVYSAEIKKERNSLFHRKVLALLRLGFDSWDPTPSIFLTSGEPLAAEKDFDKFREDVTVLAGHYVATYALDGSISLEAKSISFASMDEIEFEALFSRFVDVLLKDVLSKYTRDDIDSTVNQLLGFT